MVQRGRIVRVRMLEARFASLKPTYFPNASFTTASRVSSLMAFDGLRPRFPWYTQSTASPVALPFKRVTWRSLS